MKFLNIKQIAETFGITLCPIAIEDTLNDKKFMEKNPHVTLNDGLKEFAHHAMDAIGNNGIVIVAPQTGRRESLGEPEKRTIGTLLLSAKKNRIDLSNVAVLPIGVGIEGINSFRKEEVGGLNFNMRYTLTAGSPRVAEDLLERADGFGNIDKLVFSYIAPLVPQGYR